MDAANQIKILALDVEELAKKINTRKNQVEKQNQKLLS